MYPENWTGEEASMLCQWESEELRRGEMSTQRQRSSAAFNARVALDAIKGPKTVHE